ncbi:MAG TPA: DUF1540 domain-containing protein [Candidatus Deferrimicrobiaceae bacterium]|jgi:hypothetical protein
MTMKMPGIAGCAVSECSFNQRNQCHALAITVGGPEKCAACDTYFQAAKKGGVPDMTGGVGACKVEACLHNKGFECAASSINVGMHMGHADCTTFTAR